MPTAISPTRTDTILVMFRIVRRLCTAYQSSMRCWKPAALFTLGKGSSGTGLPRNYVRGQCAATEVVVDVMRHIAYLAKRLPSIINTPLQQPFLGHQSSDHILVLFVNPLPILSYRTTEIPIVASKKQQP